MPRSSPRTGAGLTRGGLLIVLLAGGVKDTQPDDIKEAKRIAKRLKEEMK